MKLHGSQFVRKVCNIPQTKQNIYNSENPMKRHDNVEFLLWQFNQQGFWSSTFSLA